VIVSKVVVTYVWFLNFLAINNPKVHTATMILNGKGKAISPISTHSFLIISVLKSCGHLVMH